MDESRETEDIRREKVTRVAECYRELREYSLTQIEVVKSDSSAGARDELMAALIEERKVRQEYQRLLKLYVRLLVDGIPPPALHDATADVSI
jgi:PP-loop superfamily ATP-utilizing enzyme